jgi:hypothetical protein
MGAEESKTPPYDEDVVKVMMLAGIMKEKAHKYAKKMQEEGKHDGKQFS